MQEKTEVVESAPTAPDAIDPSTPTLETTDAAAQNRDDDDSHPWELDEIIAELDREYTGRLPERALREAQRRRAEITPRLIELIRAATAQMRDGEKPKGEGYFFAFFLLTEFRAKEALPAIFEAITLPGEGPLKLYDDVITETLERTLAALADTQIELLDALIVDRQVNEYVRWAAAGVYKHLVRNQEMTREDAVDRLRRHLREGCANPDADIVSLVAYELCDLGPTEALDDVREAYRLGLVDESLIRFDHFEKSIAIGEAGLREMLERCRPTGIDDTVEELRTWACFREPILRRADASASDSSTDPLDHDFEYDEYDEYDESADDDPLSADLQRIASFARRANAEVVRRIRGDDVQEHEVPRGFSETIRNTLPPVGRNDPCPCGSGKKFKKCCGARRD
jgi:hypothetical protein